MGTVIRPEANSSPVNLAEFSEPETCAWVIAGQNTLNAMINSKYIFRFITLTSIGYSHELNNWDLPN
jgi:hypothetical protein